LVVGPPEKPNFEVGAVAADAPFADGGPFPILLLSHGFGGSARIMGWFGIAMARVGYVVIAVNHPGNNGAEPMTPAAALVPWDRAEDLRSALAAIEIDPLIGPHLDKTRIGAAGFSAGGYTALVAAGARPDPKHFVAFCVKNPDDGLCRPQLEMPMTDADVAKALASPEIAADLAHAGEGHALPEVRAAFVMAPALVQMLDPSSLGEVRVPVRIMLGDEDKVAPPATNGLVAARTIPGAQLLELPGVGHYDFLANCTDAGRATVPQCKISAPQAETHRQAIESATEFFGKVLARAPSPG
jgi:predicted dienelactone hydrolase